MAVSVSRQEVTAGARFLIAGILGPQLAGWFKDSASGSGAPVVWMTPFIIAGVACIIGAIIMKTTNPPKTVSVDDKKLAVKSA